MSREGCGNDKGRYGNDKRNENNDRRIKHNNKESNGASPAVFFVSLSEDGFILVASHKVFSRLEINRSFA